MKLEEPIFYFWFGQPPKVEVGAYNYVSKRYKTFYICLHDYPQQRKALNWGNTDYGQAELIILPDNLTERAQKIQTLLNLPGKHEHIICGIAGPMADIICPLLKSRQELFSVVSERPRIGFNDLKSSLISVGLYIKYGWLKRLKYQNAVKAFLPLGHMGVKVFARLHWPKHKLFRFMYCAEYPDFPTLSKRKPGVLRFLYIGRFGYNHALDVMMKAFDGLKETNWLLDMAGGYGEQKDEIMQWINSHERVRFIGRIDADKVRRIMAQYDCLIVPSRLDGWNCQINEALSIGCPIITHKYSVSAEMVEKSGAGIVVNSLNPFHMTRAIEIPLKQESILEIWHQKANKYRSCFTPDKVGQYLLEIISYANEDTLKKPHCPW